MIGHQAILGNLKALGAAGKLHHAQLFIGPEHVGKTKLALLLSVFLQGAEEQVILKKQILEGTNPDTVLFLDTGEGLSIEQVRGIVERASQSHSYPYLIFILENIGRMKVEAANALLKVLEEPGADVLFFLTANNEDDVLPTVKSRCHNTYFQTVPESELKEMIAGHVFEEQLLFFAMGRPGKLRRLMEVPEYLTAHQTMLQDILKFLENPQTSSVFDLVRKYESSEFRSEMLDILLQRTRTWDLMERIEESKQLLKQNVNAKLVLENLLLTFAH
ncbi:MAG: AAA family ATPase [Candidatus Gracilibacteria bacterium]